MIISIPSLLCFSPTDEKDGLTVSLKESGRLVEEAKEREVQMQNKLKAVEQQVKVLTERDKEVRVLTHSAALLLLLPNRLKPFTNTQCARRTKICVII